MFRIGKYIVLNIQCIYRMSLNQLVCHLLRCIRMTKLQDFDTSNLVFKSLFSISVIISDCINY